MVFGWVPGTQYSKSEETSKAKQVICFLICYYFYYKKPQYTFKMINIWLKVLAEVIIIFFNGRKSFKSRMTTNQYKCKKNTLT